MTLRVSGLPMGMRTSSLNPKASQKQFPYTYKLDDRYLPSLPKSHYTSTCSSHILSLIKKHSGIGVTNAEC